MKNAAILLSAHNCRAKLLSMLDNCSNQIASLSSDKEYGFRIFLYDDASTDGTADDVSAKFPAVEIIRGHEMKGWYRGICDAWKAAGDAFDFHLILNTETTLSDDAIYCLLDNSAHLSDQAIVVGSVADRTGAIISGGRKLKGYKIIAPDNDIPVPCDIFDGDMVLVPASVSRLIGITDSVFAHSWGMYEYGVRARREEIDPVVAPGILAEAESRDLHPDGYDKNPRERFIFESRARGFIYSMVHRTASYIKNFKKRK